MRPRFSGLLAIPLLTVGASLLVAPMPGDAGHRGKGKGEAFNRIATFPAYLNYDVDTESVAEIVDVSKDGMTLVYTDSQNGSLGFVDITDPADPQAAGAVDVGGEPTSVAVAGDYAIVGVNTSDGNFVAPSGKLQIIDIATQTIAAFHDLAGQPDSIAVSSDGRYAAVVIENERDEDFDPQDGEPPQEPPGLVQIVDIDGDPTDWGIRNVDLVGIPDLFPTDPEPEYVDINENNIAVVTLQENNHIVLIDLTTAEVVQDFPAGTVDLDQIDLTEEDPALISLSESENDIPREPDGVTWISNKEFVTADEGDLFGGSRGFTIYKADAKSRKGKKAKVKIEFSSGNFLDHEVVRLGHYPDGRSGNKGNEPENAEFGKFGKDEYLFVASERSSVIFVYKLKGKRPTLVQTLPAALGPEGVKAIPSRNLLIAASEEDSRDDKFRGAVNIYRLEKGPAKYPTIVSDYRKDGTPIPWGALSGFASDPKKKDIVYAIYDSFYQQSRIFVMDISEHPALITDEIPLMYMGDTLDLDPEGIAVSASGDRSFWVASEGAGTVGDPDRPVTSKNVVVHADKKGDVIEIVELPGSVNDRQVRFGFEGVASVMEGGGEVLYVAFQRAWAGDPLPNNVDDGGKVRIGRYDVRSRDWSFAYYPLDLRESPFGGWVGLSEITALGDDEYAVVERDNQGNTDARIKRVYKFSVDGVEFRDDSFAGSFETVEKELVRDLMPDLMATGGFVLEKIESLAVVGKGELLFANDNDGVDDNSGETQLFRVPDVFDSKNRRGKK